MPKIIKNLRETFLAEAKKQIEENGYAKTTIRSIAKACNVGIGTVYNYFESKDMLIASFVSEDWQQCLSEMKQYGGKDCRKFLKNVHDALCRFIEENHVLFSDADASVSFMAAVATRHAQLRGQIADVLKPLCRAYGKKDPFFAEFVAEAILSWTVAGTAFQKQYKVLRLLFEKE